MVSIGVHVYGGPVNSASVIGKYGNPYQDYIAAFGLPLSDKNLNLIPVTGNTAISAPVPSGYGTSFPNILTTQGTGFQGGQPKAHSLAPARYPVPQPASLQQQRGTSSAAILNRNIGIGAGRNSSMRSQVNETSEEGFMDVLKTAVSALPTGLGIVGGPIGALAGFALSTASKLMTESADTENATDGPPIPEGTMERAILAEAALSALQSGELHPDLEESIFSDMKDTVMKALPVIRRAAPHILGAMMEPALKIALDSLHKYNQQESFGVESFEETSPEPFRPNMQYSAAISHPAGPQAEAFLNQLQIAMRQNVQESAEDGESEESLFNIIKAGARFASRGVAAAAKNGLPDLVDLRTQAGGAGTFEIQSMSGPSTSLLAADPLAQRALVADAALAAFMKLPPQQLQEEGFFDFIAGAVKKIAPVVIKFAPVVPAAINPIIGKIRGSGMG